MQYLVRRISLGSALRVGCALGWMVALCPAVGLAVLVGQILRRVEQTVGGIAPINITVWDQTLATIDILDILNLSGTANTLSELTSNLAGTVLLIALGLTVVGAVAVTVTVVLVCWGYNLLAQLGGGLSVELQAEEKR